MKKTQSLPAKIHLTAEDQNDPNLFMNTAVLVNNKNSNLSSPLSSSPVVIEQPVIEVNNSNETEHNNNNNNETLERTSSVLSLTTSEYISYEDYAKDNNFTEIPHLPNVVDDFHHPHEVLQNVNYNTITLPLDSTIILQEEGQQPQTNSNNNNNNNGSIAPLSTNIDFHQQNHLKYSVKRIRDAKKNKRLKYKYTKTIDEDDNDDTISENSDNISDASEEIAEQQEGKKKEEEKETTIGNSHFVNMFKIIQNSTTLEFTKKRKKLRIIIPFLTIIGILCGIMNYCHEMIIRILVLKREEILNTVDPSRENHLVGLSFWIGYNFGITLIGLLIIVWIAPASDGSGLVPVKAILNGVTNLKETALSLKTLIFKAIALPFCSTPGLFVGRMGAVMHIASALAYNVTKIKGFRSIRKNKFLLNQVITCGLAIGGAVTDGAIYSGVLFALELLGTFSKRIWFKAFFGAGVAVIVHRLLRALTFWTIIPFSAWNILTVKFPEEPFFIIELFSYLVLSVIMGFFGVLFIYLHEKLLQFRDKIGKYHLSFFNLSPSTTVNNHTGIIKFLHNVKEKLLILIENRLLITYIICIITFVANYPNFFGKYMSMRGMRLNEELFMHKPLSKQYGAVGEWINDKDTDVFISLSLFLLFRIPLVLLTTIVITIGGTYLQLLVIGSAVGRLYGEGLHYLFSGYFNSLGLQSFYPGTYAMIGAISFSVSVTQALSSMLIVLELAGMELQLPSMIACLVGFVISKWMSYDTYEIVIKMRRLPMLLDLQTDSEDIKVSQVMTPIEELIYFTEENKFKFKDLEDTLQTLSKPREDGKQWPKTIPVVNNKKDMFLHGYISVRQLSSIYELKRTVIINEERRISIEKSRMSIDKTVNFNNNNTNNTDKNELNNNVINNNENNNTTTNNNNNYTEEVIDIQFIDNNNNVHINSTNNSIVDDFNNDSIENYEIITALHVDHCSLPIHTVPITTHETLPAIYAYQMFSNMEHEDLYVVNKGRLVGVLQKYSLVGVVTDKNKTINNV
ncbi:hypothetical protein ABK040_001479 [Willaertia magna]